MKVDLRKKPYNLNDRQIEWVENTLNSMNLDEKLSQLFFALTASREENYLKETTKKCKFGGVRYNPATAKEVFDHNKIIQAGTYELSENMDLETILNHLKNGKGEEITVLPESLARFWQMDNLLDTYNIKNIEFNVEKTRTVFELLLDTEDIYATTIENCIFNLNTPGFIISTNLIMKECEVNLELDEEERDAQNWIDTYLRKRIRS